MGDDVWLHPKAGPLQVAAIENGRAIVLNGWGAFVLPIDQETTRFIIRSKGPAISLSSSTARVILPTLVHILVNSKRCRLTDGWSTYQRSAVGRTEGRAKRAESRM